MAAHDLSNPLQSMTVLTELAADELEQHPAGTKLVQALEAASEMRDLVRHLARFSRTPGSPKPAGQLLDNVLQVLRRRFERQRVAVAADLGPHALLETRADALPVALLTIGLGVVRVAAESRERGLTLPLSLEVRGDASGTELRFAFSLRDGAGTEGLAPPDAYLDRGRACLGGTGRIVREGKGWVLVVQGGRA